MKNDLPAEIAQIAPRLAPGLDFLARRRMLLPGLLFFAAHRPLSFLAGQALWLSSPLELLIPGLGLEGWAALFSHPQGGLVLEKLLAASLENPSQASGGDGA
ncbi:MAG: hypothetical protein KJZ86_02725 [Caldilineaceae bacterium]|nr:hypothetical protein [Caldilineaceae bacterium]